MELDEEHLMLGDLKNLYGLEFLWCSIPGLEDGEVNGSGDLWFCFSFLRKCAWPFVIHRLLESSMARVREKDWSMLLRNLPVLPVQIP
jgi:hypothetical protein